MPITSAGLLPFRRRDGQLEVFLVHPGGPFWANKDRHAWSVAKGEVGPHENPLVAAHREFSEETGLTLAGDAVALAPVRQASGKLVHVWAVEADLDPSTIRSNTFPLEWPPHSGYVQQFQRWIAGTQWSTRKYMNMAPLRAAETEAYGAAFA